VNCRPESHDIALALAERRLHAQKRLRDRIAEGVARGELAGDPDELANFVGRCSAGS